MDGEGGYDPILSEELLAIDGYWERENQVSIGIQLLKDYPCSSIFSSSQKPTATTKLTPGVKKNREQM